jgi:hypothetical protein
MSRSKLRHCWSGILAVGALVLSARAYMIRAASSTAPTETYRATEVISHVLPVGLRRLGSWFPIPGNPGSGTVTRRVTVRFQGSANTVSWPPSDV